MVSSVEILDNKINFLISISEKIQEYVDINLDFSTFVINNNLTSTQVVLIIKALTILNYRRQNILNEHINEFKNDLRFKVILKEEPPTFNEFVEFLKFINLEVNGEKLLKSLKKQNIGENICQFLIEDKSNNWYNKLI